MMPTITIAGEPYEVVGLSGAEQASYRRYCELLAAHGDNPLVRFFARNAELTPAQQEMALRVERAQPDWAEPPEGLVLRAARHPKAVAALARRVLRPAKTAAEWESLIGSDAEGIYRALVDALQAIADPSDDQVRQTNQALREALGRSGLPPGARAGGRPEPKQPEGAEACAAPDGK